ncbi:MAG: Kazal-type serine protease inhibitor domain-containing protein [Candidatus Woesearchaeota archaeon]|nr:Kazal-type serine protease inhibitor domain-containing protein [Candidatus Woesearchaeota archaeon]MDP7323129.1 Kazal-type serine protease inhibitor domain-containing protein [Candidatus Woesearchaeota archaeon]MDP7458330.1 Kazal-type serine protease inhibitor domain-containing protein [Candidatus Woesearchaeota archaeon]
MIARKLDCPNGCNNDKGKCKTKDEKDLKDKKVFCSGKGPCRICKVEGGKEICKVSKFRKCDEMSKKTYIDLVESCEDNKKCKDKKLKKRNVFYKKEGDDFICRKLKHKKCKGMSDENHIKIIEFCKLDDKKKCKEKENTFYKETGTGLVCKNQPKICTQNNIAVIKPVCATMNGVESTILNKCVAEAIGAEVLCNKACPCPPKKKKCKDLGPVCGSDDNPYNNPCIAEKNGAEIACQGTCPCNQNQTCTAVVDPVCGTNGVTYDNFCEMQKAGAEMECHKTCKECDDIEGICPDVEDPVCGADKKNYKNSCYANQKGGTFVACKGNCPCISMISRYSLDGHANDETPRNIDGILTGVTVTNGISGQAYRFNSLTDKINLGPSLLLNPDEYFSVSAWINWQRVTANPGLRKYTIVERFEEAPGERSYYLRIQPHGRIRFVVFVEESDGTTTPMITQTAPLTIKEDQFYHITATYHVENGMRIYINGVLHASGPSGGRIEQTNTDTTIGGYISSESSSFEGIIDEVRFFSRTLLPSQVTDIYQEVITDCAGEPYNPVCDINSIQFDNECIANELGATIDCHEACSDCVS